MRVQKNNHPIEAKFIKGKSYCLEIYGTGYTKHHVGFNHESEESSENKEIMNFTHYFTKGSAFFRR